MEAFEAGAGSGYFILVLFHMYNVVVIVVRLSLFFCVSSSVSPFLCLLFSVSFSVSPFLCLLFSVSFSLSPLLCLSISLSMCCSLLLVSVIFSDSKNNPLVELFALLQCWEF